MTKGSRILWRRLALVAIRLAVGGVLIFSAVPKIEEPYQFFLNIGEYRLVGPGIAMWISMALPWLELVAGACLLANVLPYAALTVATCLFAVFVTAIASALIRGIAATCGCFGGEEVIGYWTLARAMGLLGLAALGTWLQLCGESKWAEWRATGPSLALTTAGGAAGPAALVSSGGSFDKES